MSSFIGKFHKFHIRCFRIKKKLIDYQFGGEEKEYSIQNYSALSANILLPKNKNSLHLFQLILCRNLQNSRGSRWNTSFEIKWKQNFDSNRRVNRPGQQFSLLFQTICTPPNTIKLFCYSKKGREEVCVGEEKVFFKWNIPRHLMFVRSQISKTFHKHRRILKPPTTKRKLKYIKRKDSKPSRKKIPKHLSKKTKEIKFRARKNYLP